jgi:putative nucleotidyltransferase with HDIG domain
MLEEGFDSIEIQFSDIDTELYSIKNIFDKIDGMNQHNIHHTLTIGNHCRKCAYEISKTGASPLVFIAGLLHDIGKAKTQSFLDKNGEKKDHASYYNHHNVSAYDSIIILKNEEAVKGSVYGTEDILYISALINLHMEFYFYNTEKSLDKFKNFLGKEMYADLCVIHEADVSAKYDI